MKKIILCLILGLIIVFLFSLEQKIGLFNKNPYNDYINKYSNFFDIDHLLIKAIMKKESNLNPDVVSSRGAVGLMQIMPKTALEIARQLNIADYSNAKLKEVEINIMFGTYYIKRLLNYYDNNLVLALAAYNAGTGNVDSWNKPNPVASTSIHFIPFKETRHYVESIMLIYKVYIWIDVLKRQLNALYHSDTTNA
ncbi:MAG: lytic transglycosylase domain-containing protein [Endomicrobium sp.]|jgi:soluble lytic murein transglycosylase|nr:lytic transglycosylase domain-containing protein [Endomicrobium sp.]